MSEVSPKSATDSQQFGGNYTQVNIMFPASEVELPPAEKYNAFPPDAQKAILLGFQREQMERHGWLKNQQRNDHVLNVNAQRFAFYMQIAGLFTAFVIVIVMIIGGAWLVASGASAWGVSLIITAIAGLAGTAIYGHKAARVPVRPTQKLEGGERAASSESR